MKKHLWIMNLLVGLVAMGLFTGGTKCNKEDTNVGSSVTGSVPNAPSLLFSAVISPNEFRLSWQDNSSKGFGFKIECKVLRRGDETYNQIGQTNADVISYFYTVGWGPATKSIYYRVRAYNEYGNSTYSNEADASLPEGFKEVTTPTNLTAIAVSYFQINLYWNDNSYAEFMYEIERKTDVTGTYSPLSTVSANVNSYADTSPPPGTVYYRVRATTSIGDSSGWSNETDAATQPQVDPPPP